MSPRSSSTPLVLVLLGAALLPAAGAEAQRIEVTPFAGYRFVGDVGTYDGHGHRLDRQELDGGSSRGVTLDIAVDRNFQVELLWSRQDTTLSRRVGFLGPEIQPLDLDVEYLHGGILYQWGPGQVRPFLAASIGATRFEPTNATFADDTRFSASVGGGVKLFFGRHVGARFEGRYFGTAIDEREVLVCDHFDFCTYHDLDEYAQQAEVRGGLILAF